MLHHKLSTNNDYLIYIYLLLYSNREGLRPLSFIVVPICEPINQSSIYMDFLVFDETTSLVPSFLTTLALASGRRDLGNIISLKFSFIPRL